jgi:hypothetical protein
MLKITFWADTIIELTEIDKMNLFSITGFRNCRFSSFNSIWWGKLFVLDNLG